ncbi:MAG: GspH/FimT family pseudopilin [Burkholderiales bacterium]
MKRRPPAGFTLIELMVALAIAVMLLVLAAPAYVRWLADAEVQSGAASVVAGIRGAQAEAVKRNAMVEFVIVPGAGWKSQLQGTTTALDQASFGGGSAQSTFAVTPTGATKVTFSPLGRIWTDDGTPTGKNLDGSAYVTQVDVSNVHGTRPLRIVFGGMGAATRVCDPAWTTIDPSDPKACP